MSVAGTGVSPLLTGLQAIEAKMTETTVSPPWELCVTGMGSDAAAVGLIPFVKVRPANWPAFEVYYSFKIISQVDLPRLMLRGPDANSIPANPMDDEHFPSDRERDPIAELAQLIAQIHSREDRTLSDDGLREGASPDGRAETNELPPAPQLALDLNKFLQAWDRDGHGSDGQEHGADSELRAADEECEDPYANAEDGQDPEVPRVGRRSQTLVTMTILGLVFVISASAIGYRIIFADSLSPILPWNIEAIKERDPLSPTRDQQVTRGGDAREIDPVTTGSIDNVVSHEVRTGVVGLKTAPAASLPQARVLAAPSAGQAWKHMAASVSAVADPPPSPPTTSSVPQHLSQSGGADAIDPKPPLAQAKADPPAAVTDTAFAKSYAVQVSSERSESRAQAAFRALQAKYPGQLGSQQPIIRRADLGTAGTYYRALVGSFASAEKAARMCGELKAAGGNCVILKN